jgi:hypothetical protein
MSSLPPEPDPVQPADAPGAGPLPAPRPLLLAFLQRPQFGRNADGLRWPTFYLGPDGLRLPLGPWVVTWRT